MKVVTDEKQIEEVLTRGVEMIYPNKEALKKVLMSGKKIKLYCGYDPTATSLHIGNAISINKLAQFQKLGHEVVFLIGDFTGMIGDPTDKSAVRAKLTRAETIKNSKNYKKQASSYLDFSNKGGASVLYNSAWSDKLSFKDLIEVSSNFTVQQMSQRDMFEKRIKEGKPIYLHEFLYPVAQAYDSLVMDVDLEIGGNDQTFNMLCGRDLMRAVKGKEKFVLTMKILADETGKKVGKTEGNVVNLDEKPQDMFGKIMSWSDGLIAVGFELCTNIPIDELLKIKTDLKNTNLNPRDLKLRLAREITRINHGEDKASKAEEFFVKTFQKKEIPEDMVQIEVGGKLVDVLVANKIIVSKSEARRLIEEGAITELTQNQKIKDVNYTPQGGQKFRIGKKKFVEIK